MCPQENVHPRPSTTPRGLRCRERISCSSMPSLQITSPPLRQATTVPRSCRSMHTRGSIQYSITPLALDSQTSLGSAHASIPLDFSGITLDIPHSVFISCWQKQLMLNYGMHRLRFNYPGGGEGSGSIKSGLPEGKKKAYIYRKRKYPEDSNE